MYKSILIATDGSERSSKGVEAGLALAGKLDAKVTIIFVSEPFPTYDLVTRWGLYKDLEAIESYHASSRKLADAVLTAAQNDAAAAGVACETLHIENSVPSRAIIETAASRACDLIVVASRGRGGFERLVLGSQASRVVQNAGTSVLVVR